MYVFNYTAMVMMALYCMCNTGRYYYYFSAANTVRTNDCLHSTVPHVKRGFWVAEINFFFCGSAMVTTNYIFCGREGERNTKSAIRIIITSYCPRNRATKGVPNKININT